MAVRQLPDPILLRKLIDYDPISGAMVWKPRSPDVFNVTASRYSTAVACKTWNTKNAGKPAFVRLHGLRHLSGTLFGELQLAHRIAWALHYGVRNFGILDHMNGDGRDNRIRNLRLASVEINTQNAFQRDDCSSGVTGVHWHVGKYGQPSWVARIQCGKKRVFLGQFLVFEDAAQARREAEIRLGFGPVHGKVRP